MIHRLAEEAGILAPYEAQGLTISPHSLRHSFATHCYLNGMKPVDLQHLLGHEDLESTRIYLNIPHSFREQQYRSSHPLARGV